MDNTIKKDSEIGIKIIMEWRQEENVKDDTLVYIYHKGPKGNLSKNCKVPLRNLQVDLIKRRDMPFYVRIPNCTDSSFSSNTP